MNEREAIGGEDTSKVWTGLRFEKKQEPLPYKCLDKGWVRLVDYMGSDLSIVRAARVSYDAAWRAGEDEGKDEKLIKYLWKHHHTTPFEACTVTFEVKAPIFVFRQWHRHRTQSYNEVSARYTELPDEFYVPNPMKIGIQSKSSKQARDFSVEENEARFEQLEDEIEIYHAQCQSAFRQYLRFLEEGWPRELARMVLPLSTYSKMFTTMNLRNLFHFLELRLHSHAQYEIRVYAEAIKELVRPLYPIAIAAFEESINADK
jgi:thymidylate synthase (FAD)